jgi:hypothetical protein
MNVRKTQQRYFDLIKSSRSINNWTLLSLPIALLSISTDKALASEETGAMSQINNVRQLESNEVINNPQETGAMSQITNVQQLRDVAPTDWAYEALRSLVDRYGCISGFPNQTRCG